MWVRSQSKHYLGDYKELVIICNGVYGYAVNGDSTLLGKYDTDERALRVLDTMQQKLIAGASKDVIVNGTRYSKQFVFQMPQK
ncbi:hypothetical protein [Clostridium guangxiense]|uniref:hypothetical protein n=1 Tax=Clostridium guangxiense TaxID=1662055 RepID=UPI001E647207|nr:hypothetical protein [Clostridium guangxiense]MCD2345779.1 hypothetical protein [Clostridium guangxiense]